MGNLARKIIDAVQNLFLDTLVVRLISLWWLVWLWQERQDHEGQLVQATFFIAAVISLAIGWLLGALANRRPRRRLGPLERIHESPSNGFETWAEPPEGGLRPPSILRWIVKTLGSRRTRQGAWGGLAEIVIHLAAVSLLFALAFSSQEFWDGLHPSLTRPAIQDGLWIVATAAVVLLSLRQWATEVGARLEPHEVEVHRPLSEWFVFAAFCLSTLFVALLIRFVFDWPMWSMAVTGLALGVLAVFPTWRRGVLDFWFGKRDEAEASTLDK